MCYSVYCQVEITTELLYCYPLLWKAVLVLRDECGPFLYLTATSTDSVSLPVVSREVSKSFPCPEGLLPDRRDFESNGMEREEWEEEKQSLIIYFMKGWKNLRLLAETDRRSMVANR